ncbi:hypothetical protein K0504_06885 [Neiella marina]|uniref:Sulfotransferase family protein n=1 Tax=Neiella holothuriorum TaxID=2870530 RepID=A0ABS7EEV3_9GAMM|nr:hypothetical protein [Neiella holothuriorum]MBW8190754.1 hypothetical protein [Neiella holothuriorum]
MFDDKIFFMHIAKTAGSKVNKVFRDIIDADVYQEHAEFKLDQFESVLAKNKFISGHIHLHNIRKHLNEGIFKFTVIRDGVSHLASHIGWLDHYNNVDKEVHRKRLSPQIQELVYSIKHTDITNYKELDKFLVSLSGVGIQLLDNCQCRYLLNKGEVPLSLSDLDEAIENARFLDLVIDQNKLSSSLPVLLRRLGFSSDLIKRMDFYSRVNEAKTTRKIDINVPVVRQVLARRCSVDERLYNFLFN